mmetsp:Transcript_43125/g.102752  ORF Transcript_43125/g.102752 Transcript_43125/m.102752 type:complete len:223 (-) Transcript_43125:541-1209(-)
MEEQPVALAMTRRSPKSCVMSFTWGVSPQPSQAPENSKNGFWNCEPFTVVLSISSPRSGSFTAKSQFSSSSWMTFSAGASVSASAGQMRTQSSQPVQSHGDTWMRYWRLSSTPPPMAARLPNLKVAGAVCSSWEVIRKGRTAAWGQMRLHLLHCVHLSMSTCGTLMAMPRFSYWLVPSGTRPPGTKALTGRALPSRLLQGACTCLANCSASCSSGNIRGPLA